MSINLSKKRYITVSEVGAGMIYTAISWSLPLRKSSVQQGQSLTEYGLILSLVVLVSLPALNNLGGQISNTLSGLSSNMNGTPSTPAIASSTLPELSVTSGAGPVLALPGTGASSNGSPSSSLSSSVATTGTPAATTMQTNQNSAALASTSTPVSTPTPVSSPVLIGSRGNVGAAIPLPVQGAPTSVLQPVSNPTPLTPLQTTAAKPLTTTVSPSAALSTFSATGGSFSSTMSTTTQQRATQVNGSLAGEVAMFGAASVGP